MSLPVTLLSISQTFYHSTRCVVGSQDSHLSLNDDAKVMPFSASVNTKRTFFTKKATFLDLNQRNCVRTQSQKCNFFAFNVIQLTKPAFKKFNNGTVYDKQLKNGPLLDVFSVKKAQFIR